MAPLALQRLALIVSRVDCFRGFYFRFWLLRILADRFRGDSASSQYISTVFDGQFWAVIGTVAQEGRTESTVTRQAAGGPSRYLIGTKSPNHRE